MSLSAVAFDGVESPQALSDADLRIAIAIEVFSWIGVHVDARGRIVGSPPRGLITVPASVPGWSDDPKSISFLESKIARIGISESYFHNLKEIVGPDVSIASPRQRCEAAISAVRSTNNPLAERC
jgi:hypothetical protein